MHEADPEKTEAFDAETRAGREGNRLAAPLLPERIGRFRIINLLGSGGYGLVYRAHDEELDREVALKVLREEMLRSPRHLNMLLEEARNCAHLDHPHIVPIYDVGQAPELPCYLVSKFIAGETLSQRIANRRPGFGELAAIVASIGDALHYAHQRGLVHRDVKASNILIDQIDHAWLVDFGLALRDEQIGKQREGNLVGTCAYMSPEQARGEGHLVDRRSDIFSLGVVLYEGLCGVRPFQSDSLSDLVQMITTADARPPHEHDPRVPAELERICLKALARRAVDRFQSAAEMAEDLRHFCRAADFEPAATGFPAAASGAARSRRSVVVVPKGLRAFGRGDADFFYSLVPGPRDRNGLPETIRTWKDWIERPSGETTDRGGLVYGPSGCGKSSLIQAGLLPAVDRRVCAVYVECTPRDTEQRLLRGVRERWGVTPGDLGLVETIAAIRQDVDATRKVLVVLDQFEQWLHGNRDTAASTLVAALRQCDGRRVQCLVSVRDDFWMEVTRFFRELEIELVEGRNATAIELFDLRHARKVLTRFGRAYGCLPPSDQPLGAEHERFLDAAIRGLQQDGRVISIQLALFADMIKTREWTPRTLREVGGAEGVGVSFLEHQFNSPSASPVLRRMQEPARAVLRTLLPDAGTDIKGQMTSEQDLRRAAGVDEGAFGELVRALDKELRLITPIAADAAPPEAVDAAHAPKFYQLTHDFLVAPLREWLYRKQRETMRGRAEFRLAELAAMWRERGDRRHLPSSAEYLWFLLLTRSAIRTDDQRRFMAAAGRRYAVRWAAAGVLVILTALGSAGALRMAGEQSRQQHAEDLVAQLRSSRIEEVPALLEELGRQGGRAEPLLREALGASELPERERTRVRLGLLARDPAQIDPLLERLAVAEPLEIDVIRDRLRPYRDQLVPALWQRALDSEAVGRDRLGAATMLAVYAPTDSRWQRIAAPVAGELVQQNTLYLDDWIRVLQPVGTALVAPLERIYFAPDGDAEEAEARAAERLTAAQILSRFALHDPERLVALLLEGNAAQFRTLIPGLERNRAAAAARLREELAQSAVPAWDLPNAEKSSDLPDDVVAEIEAADGLVREHDVLWHSLPEEALPNLAEALAERGWSPRSLRPYRDGDAIRVAAVWWRAAPHASHWELGLSAEQLREADRRQREAGRIPVDVAAYADAAQREGDDADPVWRYAALWSEPPESVADGQMYVEVVESEHPDAWGPLNDAGFLPRRNLMTGDARGRRYYTSVRWKRQPSLVYADLWHSSRDEYVAHGGPGWCQVDVRLADPAAPHAAEPYGGVWWNGLPRTSSRLERAPVAEHLRQCRDLRDSAARPAVLAVAADPATGRPMATSVWHTPLVEHEAADALASRQANALVALARLGDFGAVWPYLDAERSPRIRTFLIHRLADHGAPPKALVDRLAIEEDESSANALLMALAQFAESDLPGEARNGARRELAKMLARPMAVARRSAIAYLLDRWPWLGLSVDDAMAVDRPSTDGVARRWIEAPGGHTMAVIDGPVEFTMGSSGAERERDSTREVLHRRRIPRRFAIAIHETTAAQFRAFDEEFGHLREYGPSDDCPVNMVNWYDAAKYCRWLSELEEIEESEMCYPPIDEIGDGMSLPPDCLARTGYRLPTEAEWEYAARAGSSLPRFYGYAPQLVKHYAWNVDNSGYRSQRVGRLMPNGFGLFDVYGNNMEWCHCAERLYPHAIRGVHVDHEDGETTFSGERRRMLRGGAFLYIPDNARSAQRHRDFPHQRHPFTTLRVARTLPDAEP